MWSFLREPDFREPFQKSIILKRRRGRFQYQKHLAPPFSRTQLCDPAKETLGGRDSAKIINRGAVAIIAGAHLPALDNRGAEREINKRRMIAKHTARCGKITRGAQPSEIHSIRNNGANSLGFSSGAMGWSLAIALFGNLEHRFGTCRSLYGIGSRSIRSVLTKATRQWGTENELGHPITASHSVVIH